MIGTNVDLNIHSNCGKSTHCFNGGSVINNSKNPPVYPSISEKTEAFVNTYLTKSVYPLYVNYRPNQAYSVGPYQKEIYKEFPPEIENYSNSSIGGSTVRRLMEKDSPKLPPSIPGYQQLEIQSLDKKIDMLKNAIEGTKRGETKNFMLSLDEAGEARINLAELAFIVSSVIFLPTFVLGIMMNPLILLGFLGILLVGLALYAAPTDVKRLDQALADKEKVTKALNQNVQKTAEFYQGRLLADLIKDLKKDLECVNGKLSLESKPEEHILNSQRIEDLKTQAQLEKAIKELEAMVEFYRVKEEAQVVSSKETAGTFDDAVFVDAKETA